MNKTSRNIVALLFLILIAGNGNSSALPIRKDSAARKDSAQFQDDPIGAALDSLSHFNFFEKGYDVIKSPNYRFSPDSIPQYSDKVYADRMSKLDAQTPFG